MVREQDAQRSGIDLPQVTASGLDRSGLDRSGLDRAVQLLGWRGVVLPELELFGSRVTPVVELALDVHRARLADGYGPQLDDETLTVWEWPESAPRAPRPAVSLSGLLCSARGRWRPALIEAVRWRGFGPSAVLLTGAGTETEPVPADGLAEFAVRGVGLVAAGCGESASPVVRLIAAPEPGRAARRRTVDRWVEEFLYQRALDLGLYAYPRQPLAW